MSATNFGRHLTIYMEQNSLTPATVARRMGVTPTAIGHYLSGVSLPRAYRYADLAAALGLDTKTLYAWQTLEEPDSEPYTKEVSDLDTTLAEIRGALLKIPSRRWPGVLEIIRQVGRL